MRGWWKANLWKLVLFPALAGLIAIGYSLLQGTLHRWLGFDSQGRSLDGQTMSPPSPETDVPRARSPLAPGEVLATLRADLERTEPAERSQRRYLTLVHRYNDPRVSEAELELERRAVADLVAALAPSDRVGLLVAIDAERVLFRLDLSSIGWSAEHWRQLAVRYPYGLSHEGAADPPLREADEAIRAATGDRLPAVRADWLVAALALPPLGGPVGSLGLGAKVLPERVQEMVMDYAGQPLDLVRAARELGAGAEAVRRLLTEEAYLREEFGLAPLLEGRTIPRDAWESARNLTSPFQELSTRLGLGKPINIR